MHPKSQQTVGQIPLVIYVRLFATKADKTKQKTERTPRSYNYSKVILHQHQQTMN
jgi:hypothetical protein